MTLPSTSPFVGHDRQRSSLAHLIRTRRLPSTLLFAGVPGIGKLLAAQEVARHLLCQNRLLDTVQGGCGSCKACVLCASGNHPDLHVLSIGGSESTSVDDIRSVLDSLNLTSFLGGNKLAIFDDADNLSIVGSNIILKSLEEPRPDCYFILVASNPSRLPATLLSRCQRWFFDRLRSEELKTVLENRGESDISEALLMMADGSLTALESVRADQEGWDSVKAVIEAAFRGEDDKVAKAAQEWGSDKGTLRDRITFIRMIIQQKLMQSHNNREAAAVWATGLHNVLDAEYLLFDRHVTPVPCLIHLLRSCNSANAWSYMNLPNSQRTLMEIVGA